MFSWEHLNVWQQRVVITSTLAKQLKSPKCYGSRRFEEVRDDIVGLTLLITQVTERVSHSARSLQIRFCQWLGTTDQGDAACGWLRPPRKLWHFNKIIIDATPHGSGQSSPRLLEPIASKRGHGVCGFRRWRARSLRFDVKRDGLAR